MATVTTTDEDEAAGAASRVPAPQSRAKQRMHYWFRWAHVYISMFSLLVMLFFGVTGITLNHPSWVFGDEPTLDRFSGALPAEALAGDSVEFLIVSEYIRAEHNVAGEITNFGVTDGDGTITYKAPGYGADLFFDPETGNYDITISQQGFVGVMNDLHKGRDSSTVWRWIIDLSGVLLVAIAVTGIGIQILLRKRRGRALAVSALGAILCVFFIWLAMP